MPGFLEKGAGHLLVMLFVIGYQLLVISYQGGKGPSEQMPGFLG
jgi:hypothetical protein